MSLLIPGMELDGRPHKALFTERDGKPVLVVETQYSYADNDVKVYPVEEIPPHGRLIDADELYERYWAEERTLDKPYIDYLGILAAEAPTVIQAEGKEAEHER